MKLGDVTTEWDEHGRERREIVAAFAECPTCQKDVALIADTEEWVKRGGKWVHSSYGPSLGQCCGNLIVDSFDGCKVYKLAAGGKEKA